MEEENSSSEKKEWPSKTSEEPPVDDEKLTTPDDDAPEEIMHGAQGPDTVQSPMKPVEKPEECDPMTMNCSEMPKFMAELTKRSEILGTGLKKLEEINESIPSDEGKQLYTRTSDEKAKVDGKIEDIVMRFSKCTLSEEKEEEEEEEIPPES